MIQYNINCYIPEMRRFKFTKNILVYNNFVQPSNIKHWNFSRMCDLFESTALTPVPISQALHDPSAIKHS